LVRGEVHSSGAIRLCFADPHGVVLLDRLGGVGVGFARGDDQFKENDLVVPLLAATPGVSLHELLGGMHQLLGDASHATAADADEVSAGCGGHTCSCGEVDGPGYPELDVRSVPHAIRHATIFGALESVRPGAGLELVAPHDPLPLLDQVNQRWPGRFSVTYSERGPEAWRLTLVRTV
jgi:uncharacterized protein (DUF2249 family)